MEAPTDDADYLQEIDKARRELLNLIVKKNCAPIVLRLAWRDTEIVDSQSKTGEPNRSNGNGEGYTHGDNSDLKIAFDLCEGVKAKHPKITYADLYQLAGVVAVEVTGGTDITFVPGRKVEYAFDAMEFHPRDIVMHKTGTIGFVALHEQQLFAHSLSRPRPFPFQKADVTLLSRDLRLGDTVFPLRGTAKYGVVVAVSKIVDLASHDDGMKMEVCTEGLRRTLDFYVDDLVISGRWLGEVRAIHEWCIQLRFRNGACVGGVQPSELEPFIKNSVETGCYYKGQRVLHKAAGQAAVVTSREVLTLRVSWFLRQAGDEKPAEIVKASDVRLFQAPIFSSGDWTYGSRCKFLGKEFFICNVHPSFATIKWKSGEDEEVDTRQLVRSDTEIRFFDGKFQIRDLVCRKKDIGNLPYFGIVSGIDSGNNVVIVGWEDGTTSMVPPDDIGFVEDVDAQNDDGEDDGQDDDGEDDDQDENSEDDDQDDGGEDSSEDDASDSDEEFSSDSGSDSVDDGGEVIDP